MTIPQAARAYAATGWALVEFPRGRKGPVARDWNLPERVTTTPEEAELFNENTNIGLCHAYSRTCVLDIDAWGDAENYLRERGIHLASLLAQPDSVRINSGREGRAKLLYRLPDGAEPLPSKRPTVPGPDGPVAAGLELRCATSAGLTVQDVLPPSVHPITQKPYTWEYGDDLTGHWSVLPVLPDALLGLWRALLAPPPGSAPAPDNTPKGLAADRLRGMLARLDPDMEYNQWAKVGMALHHETEGSDEGLALWDEWSAGSSKYKDTSDLSGHWRSFGKNRGRPVTVQSLISMSGGVSADDFDDLTALPEQTKRPRFEIVPVGAFAAGPQPEWIIKDVLPAATLGVCFAESGAGKSFAMFDMACAVARGEPWNGKRVRQGRVVYLAAEGAGGMRKRAAAWASYTGVKLADMPLGVIADQPNLLKEDYRVIAERVNGWGGCDLLIVDTLAQSMMGGDENSGEDMGKLLTHCQRLHAATGAMVLLIHHSGKDVTRGARGWSGLKAACDVEIEVARDGDQRTLRISKQKDGEDGIGWGFRLNVVELGVDADGDPLKSCVCVWGEMPATNRRWEPQGVWQRAVWNAVLDNAELCDGEVPIMTAIEFAVLSLPHDPTVRDRRRNNCMRAMQMLITAGKLVKSGENVSVISNKPEQLA